MLCLHESTGGRNTPEILEKIAFSSKMPTLKLKNFNVNLFKESHMESIIVRGMTCEHCRASVTKALLSVPGVASAEVDLASGKAGWTGNNVNPETVKEAVRAIGFETD